MRLLGIAILASVAFTACSLAPFPTEDTGGTGGGGRTTAGSGGATGGTGDRTAGSGGTTAGTGGSTSTAGATATGGRNGSGGFTGTGGTTVTYGGTAAGGFTGTAGTTATSGGAGTGGSIGTGGTTVANGGTGTGGYTGAGGTTTGDAGFGTGGSTGTGGTTVTSGGAGTGGYTGAGGTTTGDAGFGTGGSVGTGGTTSTGTGIDADVDVEPGPEPGPESSAESGAEPAVEFAPEAPDAGADTPSTLPDSAFDLPPPPPPDLAPEVGPGQPANLRIQRESDITRQVRLSWDYPSAVDIYIHNGDANGYYVESFSGAAVVPSITGGTWLDTDAPSHQARYYRVRAVDSGQWAIDTAMKWDFDVGCGMPYTLGSLPAGGGTLSEVVGDQLPCGSFEYDQCGVLLSAHICNATPPQWDSPDVPLTGGFYLDGYPPNCPGTVTTVGLLTSGDSQPYVNSACSSSSFFGIHFPQPVSLSEIDWSHSHGGSGPSDGDVISLWFYGATAAWTGCWRSTDGHWYRESNNALCDSEQLLPGQGYWYTARNSSVTFTIPKPYSNP